MSNATPLWQPSEDRVLRSRMWEFMQRVAQRHNVPAEWEALRRWSIQHRGTFWQEILHYAEIELSEPPSAAFSGTDMLDTRWFPGARLNYARHLLRYQDDEPALLFENEQGQSRSLSHRALRDAVARFAEALRRDGVHPGDRVAGFLPNLPETVIAMLATASLGAVWTSCSPDFGVAGALDRFGQIAPTVFVATDGYTYGGKEIDCVPRVVELVRKLPMLRRVVIVPYLAECRGVPLPDDAWRALGDAAAAGGTCGLARWSEALGAMGAPPPPLTFHEVPFDHPLFIMYSSGTTGIPKCIVHGHGGTLLQHMKELMLHTDLHRGQRAFYFTTCGWMMWNWLVSGLGTGAAVVLYEGNPAHPDVHHLWSMASRLRVNVFGTSPKFVSACQKADIHPGRDHDLTSLRCVCSTGSPLAPEQFHWIYERVGADLQLASICGGTDIISCFMLGNPMLPVYPGEIQCRGLGMDVQAWSEDGRPVEGEKGELVCLAPFPSQPVGFWNDPDRRAYHAAYFEHFPGVWRHGDFIEITPRGGVIVYGRSDATLNPGGVRIGTAEIYRLVEALPEVTDSVVVGIDADGDEEIALFVVLKPGLTLDLPARSDPSVTVAQAISRAIAAGATRRHVPRHIRQVSDIPRTISGKKVERAVRQMLRGEPVRNRDALANPEALEQFRAALAR